MTERGSRSGHPIDRVRRELKIAPCALVWVSGRPVSGPAADLPEVPLTEGETVAVDISCRRSAAFLGDRAGVRFASVGGVF